MDKLFIIKLAFKNLMARKLRTLLTLGGIMVGISAIVFLVSFAYGVQKMVTDQIASKDAFKLIDVGTGSSKIIKLNTEIQGKITQIQGIEEAETITNLGGKAKNGQQTKDVAIFGVSSPNYLDWSGKVIKYGNNLSSEETGEAVINTAYATFLTSQKPDTLIGQKILADVFLGRELSAKNEAQAVENQEFTVVGVVKDESSPAAYIKLGSLTTVAPDYFSQIKVKAQDENEVTQIRSQIESYGLQTEFVGDTVKQVEQFFNMFKIILGSFGVIALVVAILGMFNTLTISLMERMKEIALLKILGMGRKSIQIIFLTEAMVLGVVGGLLGIFWGMLLGKIANGILNIVAIRAGGDPVAVFYYSPGFLILVMLIALLTGLLTGLYPARRAAKVNALNVMRYE